MDVVETEDLKKKKALAEKGYYEACRRAGFEYEKADDFTNAMHYYKKGTDLGDLNCQYALATSILLRDSCPFKDKAAGIALLDDAAFKGHVESMARMGEELLMGMNTSRDPQRAVILFKRYTETILLLAEIGSLDTLIGISARSTHLVICQALGIGCKQDTAAAQKLLEQLAKRNFFAAQYMIEKKDIDIDLQCVTYYGLPPEGFDSPVILHTSPEVAGTVDVSAMFGRVFRDWEAAGFFR